MSGGDSSTLDFDDLLAAYNIPDVTVRIREATTEDGPASPDGGGEEGGNEGGGDEGKEGEDAGKEIAGGNESNTGKIL